MDALRDFLSAWYLELKWIHIMAVAVWAFSTAVAYSYYVAPAFRSWLRHPDDPARLAERDRMMDRFDQGAILEHVAFPILIVTGIAMVWAGGWALDEVNWLTVKLAMVVGIFGPVEAVDYYISHMGGQKARIRATGDMARHERMTRFHWLFFRVTTPLVMIFIPLIYFFAVVKPL